MQYGGQYGTEDVVETEERGELKEELQNYMIFESTIFMFRF